LQNEGKESPPIGSLSEVDTKATDRSFK